jgi:adenosylmethionine-8-amino-7-oxononanoate aminotransferase
MYEPVLMDDLLQCCKENDILCIADEVMTGFGRTGKLFASDYILNKPDIICLSKGLTGGTMALGVTACNDKIVNAFKVDDKIKTFFHGHSFTANPLACTAALASLELLLRNDCLKNIELITASNAIFTEKLCEFPNIKNQRNLGTIVAFEINTGKDEYLNDISAIITAYLLKKSIYLRPLGNTVYIMPPFCITEIQLQEVYTAICDCIKETK